MAVREFHRTCGYQHNDSASVDSAEQRTLWGQLIAEETGELLDALRNEDVVKVADGLADTIYVCIGAALAFGIPLEEVFNEVHRSNMSKVSSKTGGVERRADGKILRGPYYSPPNIAGILKNHIRKHVNEMKSPG